MLRELQHALLSAAASFSPAKSAVQSVMPRHLPVLTAASSFATKPPRQAESLVRYACIQFSAVVSGGGSAFTADRGGGSENDDAAKCCLNLVLARVSNSIPSDLCFLPPFSAFFPPSNVSSTQRPRHHP